MIKLMCLQRKNKEKYRLLGVIFRINKMDTYFLLSIPDSMLYRGETNQYCILLPRKFVKKNFMEEIIISYNGKKYSFRIEKKIFFTWNESS